MEIADVLETYASFQELIPQWVHGSKDEHFITQKDNQPQSDLFWGIHQNAALCYLLLFLCNWGV